MNHQGQLSSALRITNVNDFLAPTTSCVLPVEGGAIPAGSVLAPIVPTSKAAADAAGETGKRSGAVAKVTVSDCLSCSGCVTSAETVLLSTENVTQLRNFISKRSGNNTTKQQSSSSLLREHFAAAVLSQQSVASIAVHFDADLTTAARKCATFLTTWGCLDAVVDATFARHIALLESGAEFVRRFRDAEQGRGGGPLIASACPGWLTYAEKTQDVGVLARMSHVRSPQGVVAGVADCLRAEDDTRPIWLLSVAQCHDRKLEAVRPELMRRDDGRAQPDCVITTAELVGLMEDAGFDFQTAAETPLQVVAAAANPPASTDPLLLPFGGAAASPSDGYAATVMCVAARELLRLPADAPLPPFRSVSRSGDVRVATLSSEDASIQLRFAIAYGFRSLQSILRKMRAGSCLFDYIELMACPGGCTNGGGQLPPPQPQSLLDGDGKDYRSAKALAADHLQAVDDAFNQAPPPRADLFEDPQVRAVYDKSLGGKIGSDEARCRTTVAIQSRKSTGGMSSLDW